MLLQNGIRIVSLILLAVVVQAQIEPPEIGRHLPDPGPSHIEVRFALGKKAVRCEHFELTAKIGTNVIISGEFTSGFEIPIAAQSLSKDDVLKFQFKCGKQRWQFNDVGARAFLPGWWFVGTDYPPFQERFQGPPEFADADWIQYLIIHPSKESGFYVEKHSLKKKR